MKELVFVLSRDDSWKKQLENLKNYTILSHDGNDILKKMESSIYEKAHFLAIGESCLDLLQFYTTAPHMVASMIFSDMNLDKDLSFDFSIPTLFIHGENDSCKKLEKHLFCSQFIELKGLAPNSFPEKWSNHLLSFWITSRYEPLHHLKSSQHESTIELKSCSVAERLLTLLKLRGIDFIFSNSGTDFTPIIDAYAGCDEEDVPEFICAPHENTTISMAHGYFLMTRRIQGVMAHVHVGTANVGLGIMNARRSHTPIFVMAGRSPYYEEGKQGVRTNFVQWGQESYDQGITFREFTKWDYELKSGHALDKVVERGIAIATSDPKGPVYMTLPKEPLCEKVDKITISTVPRMNTTLESVPQTSCLEMVVKWIKSAKKILIIVADYGRFVSGPETLVKFSELIGAGVIEYGKRNFFNFPTEHPHHLGFEPLPHLFDADLVLSIECPVPWIPAFLPKDFKAPTTISIAVDALFSDLPLRGFPCDLSLSGNPVSTLQVLCKYFEKRVICNSLSETHDKLFTERRENAKKQGSLEVITKSYLSYKIGEIIDDDCILFNEYPLDPFLVPRRTSNSWFENSCASGLGWCLGAALGGQLALPNKTVIATVGDGSYLFNTPLSAHHVASSYSLPIIIIVFNDTAWSTIKKSVKGSHPSGSSVKKDKFILCDFDVNVEYHKICEATGGKGFKVEHPNEIEKVLREAIRFAREEKVHVLVNVVCERDG